VLRRPTELRYHILKNRYLTLLKNDRPAHVLRDILFIKAREIALVGIAIASGLNVVTGLLGARRLYARALRKRSVFLSTPGEWGNRRCGLPSAWLGERLLEEEDEP
jgi:hypothetical protein